MEIDKWEQEWKIDTNMVEWCPACNKICMVIWTRSHVQCINCHTIIQSCCEGN